MAPIISASGLDRKQRRVLSSIKNVGLGRPSIRAKALSRTKISSAVPSTAFFAREVEDQDSGNLTLNHISVEDRFHQPSIRSSTSTMILLCEHPTYAGCESAQSPTCGLA